MLWLCLLDFWYHNSRKSDLYICIKPLLYIIVELYNCRIRQLLLISSVPYSVVFLLGYFRIMFLFVYIVFSFVQFIGSLDVPRPTGRMEIVVAMRRIRVSLLIKIHLSC